MKNLTAATDNRKADGREAVAVEALAALGVPDAGRWVAAAIEAASRTAGDPPREGLVVRSFAEIEPEPVRWLWHGRIPLGGLTAMVGDPGAGKSTVSLAIATAVTLGAPLPGDPGPRDPADVLVVSAEDSPRHTIRPRLDAMGADVSRVHEVGGVRRADGQIVPLHLADPVHRAHLREAMETYRPRLVIIDPITAYLAETDTHRDADVRTVLAPLAELAAEYDAAIVYIMHLRKSQADRAIYRAGGSIAFIGAARSALLVGRDPDDGRRGIAHIKSNLSPLAPTVGFEIVDGRFVWVGESDLTADRMLAPATGDEERSAIEEATDWLAATLEGGDWVPASEIMSAARRDGISDRTLRRAAARLEIEKSRRGVGRSKPWYWRLRIDGQGGWPPNHEGTLGHLMQDVVTQQDSTHDEQIGGQTYLLATYSDDDDIGVTEGVA